MTSSFDVRTGYSWFENKRLKECNCTLYLLSDQYISGISPEIYFSLAKVKPQNTDHQQNNFADTDFSDKRNFIKARSGYCTDVEHL